VAHIPETDSVTALFLNVWVTGRKQSRNCPE
jgi:hypothetical protein